MKLKKTVLTGILCAGVCFAGCSREAYARVSGSDVLAAGVVAGVVAGATVVAAGGQSVPYVEVCPKPLPPAYCYQHVPYVEVCPPPPPPVYGYGPYYMPHPLPPPRPMPPPRGPSRIHRRLPPPPGRMPGPPRR